MARNRIMGVAAQGVTHKIEDLQVLRAVAILLVLLQHLSLTSYIFLALSIDHSRMPFWIGVELFFVISGFVVTESILSRPLSPFGFLIRRAFRLYPAIIFFLILSAAVCFSIWLLPTSASDKERYAGTLRSFMIDGAAILAGVLTITGQSSRLTHGAMWSLSVEFQFYFTYALAIFSFLLLKGTKFRHVVFWIAATFYMLLLASRLFGPFQETDLPALIKYLLFFKIDFLLLGVIGSAGLKTLVSERALNYGPFIAPLLILVSLVLIACVEPFRIDYAFSPLLDGIIVPITGILFLGLILLASYNRAFVGHTTSAYRFFVWIGELSYAIYL